MSELTAIPPQIEAGTTVRWRRTYATYPANDGWAAKLFLSGRTQKVVDAGSDGADFTFELTAAISAALGAGATAAYTCDWAVRGYKDADVVTIERGSILILPDVATQLGDRRPQEEIWLEVIDARIGNRLTKDQETIQIEGIAITRIPIEKCFAIKARLESAIAHRRAGGGMPPPITIRLTGTR